MIDGGITGTRRLTAKGNRRRGKTARRRRDCCASHRVQICIYTHTCIRQTHTNTRTRARLRERERRDARAISHVRSHALPAVQLQLCVQAGNAGGGMEAAQWAHSLPGPSVLYLRLSRSISRSLSLCLSLRSVHPSLRVSPLPQIVRFLLSLFPSYSLSSSDSSRRFALPAFGFSLHLSLSLSSKFPLDLSISLSPRGIWLYPCRALISCSSQNAAIVFLILED